MPTTADIWSPSASLRATAYPNVVRNKKETIIAASFTYRFSIVIAAVITYGCVLENSSRERPLALDGITTSNRLYLTSEDDKYGEWGGDTEIVIVHRDAVGDGLHLEYRKYAGSKDPPPPPKGDHRSLTFLESFDHLEMMHSPIHIPMTKTHQALVEESIDDLLTLRLSNSAALAMSGRTNRINDDFSSINITDYPAGEWASFDELVKVIKEE